MKVYGDPLSTNTRKVLVTLAELNTPYELVLVEFASGQHKQPEHLARQPFGKMPALNDDGFALYETHAICRYLNDRAGGPLMPAELRERAQVDQWMSIETACFSGPVMRFVYHYLLKFEQSPTDLEQAAASLGESLKVLERQLSQHACVAGPTFSLADVCYMPYFEYGVLTPAQALFAEHPSVMAWWDRVRARPAWQSVIAAPADTK